MYSVRTKKLQLPSICLQEHAFPFDSLNCCFLREQKSLFYRLLTGRRVLRKRGWVKCKCSRAQNGCRGWKGTFRTTQSWGGARWRKPQSWLHLSICIEVSDQESGKIYTLLKSHCFLHKTTQLFEDRPFLGWSFLYFWEYCGAVNPVIPLL